MKRPINLDEAEGRRLLVDDDHGIHTFSNGTDWECWASGNCLKCWYWPPDGPAGEFCAFEAASLLHSVSPELARLFGWAQMEKYATYDAPRDPKGSHRHGWIKPDECPCFLERPEKGEGGDDDPPPPPRPDPTQLVLIADPTEDASIFANTPETPSLQEVGA